jgi:RNA polymerase sigma-70 factor (ECF subfamily)
MRLLRTNKKSDLSDENIISRYKNSGDKECISILFDRYSMLVFGVCMKYLKDNDEAQDAVMKIFEKLMDDLKKFEVAKFKSWLHVVAKNYCFMQLRNKQALTERAEELAEHDEMLFNISEDESDETKTFMLEQLDQAIQQLKTEQKICIELFYLKEMCYKDVADLTGFTSDQVKSYIQNGKRNLKIILTQQHEIN